MLYMVVKVQRFQNAERPKFYIQNLKVLQQSLIAQDFIQNKLECVTSI